MLRLGIVGLPNVGKSTLFNALTSAGALVANYPFATIEPNTGIVQVPDPRLDVLAGIVSPERTVPAVVEFVDLADLASVEKRLDKTTRVARSGDPQARLEQRLLEAVRDALAAGRPARSVQPSEEEAPAYRSFNLLTSKPVLYAANVG